MKNIFVMIFARSNHICPWWLCYTFDNPLRRLFQNPDEMMATYVKKGFTVIDIGPGIGYFTISLLKLVGTDGTVIALDIQEKMLSLLKRRAVKAGAAERLVTHLAKPDAFSLKAKADFILAFWMLHEVSDQLGFFSRLKKIMKSNARVLIVEPKIHVSRSNFVRTMQMARQSGFLLQDYPRIALSRAILLRHP
jgi:ubiquinone/menaquinone biosynthesis C-methylase UbiE